MPRLINDDGRLSTRGHNRGHAFGGTSPHPSPRTSPHLTSLFSIYSGWFRRLRRRKNQTFNVVISCLVVFSLLISPFQSGPLSFSGVGVAVAQPESGETPLPPPPEQRTEQPWVDPQLPSLTFDLDIAPRILTVGGLFTATLTVSNQSPYPADNLTARLPLPVGAVAYPDPQPNGWIWQLARLSGDATFTRSVVLRVPQMPPGEAVVTRAQVTANRLNFPVADSAGALVLPQNPSSVTVSYTPGVSLTLRTPNGRVEVQVPADAADRPLTLEYSLQPGGRNRVPPRVVGFKHGLPAFYLNATDAQGREFHNFAKPITITVGYTRQQAEALGYTPEDISLFWFDESQPDGGLWLPIPTSVDTTNRRLTALVSHFSTFAAAEDFRPSDQFIPSLKDWQVGLFRGNVNFDYDIEVPEGPDGIKPQVKLSYDSAQTDGPNGMKQKQQSSWVGKGWSLDTGYIAYNKLKFGTASDPGHYSLVLNGQTYDLMRSEPITGTPRLTDPTDYAWRTTNESFNRIRALPNGDSTPQRGGYSGGQPLPRSKWQVWTKDGTRYEFEEDAWWGWSNCGVLDAPSAIEYSGMEAYKWHLSKVVDTHGNVITYTYGRKTKQIQSTCGPSITGIADYDVWPLSITWAGARDTGTSPRYMVEFKSIDRTIDTDVDRPNNQMGPEVKETQQLEEIRVKSNRSVPYGTNAWELIRRYDLRFEDGADWHNYLLSDASNCPTDTSCEPISSTKKLTLKELRLFGSDDITYLPPITFTYWLTRGTGTYPDGGWNRLWKVDNNQGGLATFEYETIGATMGTAIWAKHYKNNRRVTSRKFEDGRGHTYTWTYSDYRDPAYNSLGTSLTSNDSGPNNYPTSATVYYNEYQNTANREQNRALLVYKRNTEFRGHSYVKETDPNGDVTEHWFYQGNLGTQGSEGCYPRDGNGKPLEGDAILSEAACFMPMRDREFLKGKEYKTIRHQGTIGTNTKLSEVQHDFLVSFFEYGDTLNERLTGLWRAFPYERANRDIAWERGSTPLTKTIEYTYDISATNTITYGNLISTKDYDTAGVVLREITSTYNVLSTTNSYIVDRKRSEAIKSGTGGWLAFSVNAYDGSNSPDSALIRGDLTLGRKYYDVPSSPSPAVTIHSSDTSYTYDSYGNQVTVTTYDGYGTALSNETNWSAPGGGSTARIKTTQYDPNFNAFPVRITETIPSLVEQRDYDYRMGVMTRTLDYNNVPTELTYDLFGRNKSQVKFGDTAPYPTAWVEYYDWERPVRYLFAQRETSGTNAYRPTQYFYDGMGREIQNKKESRDCRENIVEDKQYDGLGQVLKQSQPRYVDIGVENCDASSTFWDYFDPIGQPIRWTTNQYDAAQRKVRVEEPDPAITTTMQYAVIDGRRAMTTTDALRHATRRDSDVFGRLTAVQEYSGTGLITDTYRLAATTRYDYSPLDLLTVVTDTYTKTTTIQYDTLGRKTQMTDPTMGTWRYEEYTPSGNIKVQRDNRNKRITFSYDAMDRLTGKSYPDGSGDAATYRYDEAAVPFGKGQRTSMSRVSGTTISWEYDERGRKVKATHAIPGLPSPGTRIFRWGYDSADRTTTVTYPSVNIAPQTTVTEQVRYEFDAAWRQVRVCTNETQYNSVCYADNATYTALDQPVNYSLNNGLVQNYEYTDPMMRLWKIKVGTTSSPGAVFNRWYTYQPVGNVSGITKRTPTDAVEQTQNFTYDERDRLTQWVIPESPGYKDERYSYDNLGNILVKDKSRSQTDNEIYTYIYGGAGNGGPYAVRNVRETIGNSTPDNLYTYDQNGNTLTSDGPSRNRSYTWNVDNQPTQIQAQGGGQGVTESYLYDADGERVKRTRANRNTYYAEGLWEEEYQGNNQGADTVRIMYKFRDQVVAQREVHPNRTVPGNGLRGDYYNNANLTNFQTTIYSPTVNFDWRAGSPDVSVEPERFSVEWTGNVTTTVGGTYSFSTVADGGVKLWVNNQLVIDTWTATSMRTDSAQLTLQGGQQYPIKLQFSDGVGTGQVQLQWLPPGNSQSAAIPTGNLSPPAADLNPPSDPNRNVVYFHTDHLGSISVVTDWQGAQGQPERQEFDPWGLVLNPPGPPVNSTSLNYTGQRLDGTDLLYYHARYYDPRISRFVSPDSVVPGIEDGKGGAAASIGATQNHRLTVDFQGPGFVHALHKEHDLTTTKGFWFQLTSQDRKETEDPWGPINPQVLNRYSYVLNNPVKYTDPTGHILDTILDVGFIAWDLGDIWNEGLTWETGGALLLDVGGALIPFVPSVAGVARRGAKVAVKGLEGASKVPKGVQHSFDKHATQWFGTSIEHLPRGTYLPRWQQLIETAKSKGRSFDWDVDGKPTIAYLYREGNRYLAVQYYRDSGELATAFVPKPDQLAAMWNRIRGR